jgi:hypothetical protein
MAYVRFTVLSLFLEELWKDAALVDRRMVRMVEFSDGWSATPGLRYLRLIVTARVGQDILRVDSYCGATCGISAHDQQVREQLARQRRSLEKICAALGIEVRFGILDSGGLERLTEL